MLAKSFRSTNLIVFGAILLFVLLYGFVLVPRGYFQVPRLKTQDLFFKVAHALNTLPKEIRDVTIVTIDDESLSMINEKWPWERQYYAQLLDQLRSSGPKVVAFDIVFLGKSVNPASDRLFVESLRDSGNVILASYASENGAYVKPYDMFARASSGFGLINKPRDPDDLVRSARLLMRTPGDRTILDYTLETKALCRFFGIGTRELTIRADKAVFSRPWAVGGEVGVDIHIPLRQDGTFLVNYIARLEDFTVLPIWRVLSGEVDPEDIKGRLVLVGQTNEIIHDIHPTPLGLMPGVIISANILLTILSDRFIHLLSPFQGGLELLLFTLLTFLITMKLDVWKGALSCLGMLMVYGWYAFFLFRHSLVGDFFSVPFFVPIIFVTIQLYRSFSLFIENLSLKQDAITDGLTGLYIHKYLLVRLQNELDRAIRYRQKLALALIDIDFFKKFNDSYGHEEGNRALIHFSNILRDSFRKVDLLFRYGGEEFCVVLPGNDMATAWESLERFRVALASTPIRVGDADVFLTASIGLAAVPEESIDDIHDFLKRSDKALYSAKKAGRNRTIPSQKAA